MASSAGVIARRMRSLRPANSPMGTPIASERSTAADIRASVWMLSSQRPMSAKDTNEANTISAARQPPKRRTMSVLAATTPGQVSHSSASLRAVTIHSASARKPSKIAKMRLGFSAVRCSSSQSWRSSRRTGSSTQVSDVGQGNSSRNSANSTTITSTIPATSIGRPRQRELGAAKAGAERRRLATATGLRCSPPSR